MKNKLFFLVALLCLAIFSIGCDGSTGSNLPPGQPEFGYGSTENYIADTAETVTFGKSEQGTGCVYYIPGNLKSNPAPVVVFLHGMALQDVKIYMDHIQHLVKQGNIVIFPQFNKEGIGMLSDLDQNMFLERAVMILNEAFDRLGDLADTNDVVYYGHSLGGFLAATIPSTGRVPEPKSIIIAHIVMGASDGPVKQKPIDWQSLVKDVTCPITILTGDADTLGSLDMAKEFYNGMANASSKVLYMAQSDNILKADHQGPASAKSGLASNFGGNAVLNTYDFRFYWAVLDAALDNKTRVDFNMGNWEDGTPVLPILKIVP